MFAEGDRELAELAASHHGVFSAADATASGLSKDQIRFRSLHVWRRVHDGVFRQPGAVQTWKGDLLAACLAATKPVAVSHRSGAEFYELPGRREDLIEISCRRWNRTQKPGLIVHESTRFGDIDITEIDGIPVSTPERVILELAGLKPYPNYVEAVIHARAASD